MDNPVVEKSKIFAVNIVRLTKYLTETKKENIMSRQILRSGTSIGANIAEAQFGQSNADFCSKMSIALKEASETRYWLELLFQTEYIDNKEFENLNAACNELIKLLVTIVKTSKH